MEGVNTKDGLTMVLDKGLGLNAVDDLLLHSRYFNIVKLGWGTALLYDHKVLSSKVAKYQNSGIEVCTGGTLFEYALQNDVVSEIRDYVKKMGIETVEVSNGTIPVPTKEKHEIIKRFIEDGFNVYSEIGRKSPNYDWHENVEYLINESKSDLDAGAKKVIIEARESGNSGIYTSEGELVPILDILTNEIGVDNLIFEAPQKRQQTNLIKKYSKSVHIGNVKPEDVLSLASLRYGYRSDTLDTTSRLHATFQTEHLNSLIKAGTR